MRYGSGLQRAIGRRPTKVGVNGEKFRVPIRTSAPTEEESDPAALDHYWHPDRDGVESAPSAFQRELELISTDVRVVRPPANAPLLQPRAWLIWYRCGRVTHPLSPGWLMIRDWRDGKGQPLRLDDRVFSLLYAQSARVFGNAKKYWDHCLAEMNRDKAALNKLATNERKDVQSEFVDYMQIKNIGAGNKFAKHHDGTVIPSQGQRNWHLQERKRQMPSLVIQSERDARG